MANNKSRLLSDLENVGQGHDLQNSLYVSYEWWQYEWFLWNFHRNDGNVAGNKNFISANFKNVGEGHPLQKSLSWLLYDQLLYDQLLYDQLLYDQLLYDQNDATGACNKSITSADREDVGQGQIS